MNQYERWNEDNGREPIRWQLARIEQKLDLLYDQLNGRLGKLEGRVWGLLLLLLTSLGGAVISFLAVKG